MNSLSQQINIFKPFGPAIAKTNIPQELIEKLNSYYDNVHKNNEKK